MTGPSSKEIPINLDHFGLDSINKALQHIILSSFHQ
jgi:hypothetical protein